MIHVKPDNLGVAGIGDYGSQNEVEPVKVCTEEEVGRRAELKVFSFEESAAGACPQVPDTLQDIRFSALKELFYVVGAKEVFVS